MHKTTPTTTTHMSSEQVEPLQNLYKLMDNEKEPSSSGSAQKRPGVFRACNACRQRKVKCNGESHCSNCIQAGLTCIYSSRSLSARSRQSIIRGGVIATCRGQGPQNLPHKPAIQNWEYLHVTPALRSVSIDFFWNLVDDYCSYTLPTVPIVGEKEFRAAIRSLDYFSENSALVYCLAAQTINLTRVRTSGSQSMSDDARSLFEMALRARGPLLNLQQITVQTVLVSILASMGMFAAKRDPGMGPFYHLEAVAGLQALRIDDKDYQASLDPKLAAQRERLHWLVYVHNRFQCLSENLVSVLSPLPQPPRPDADIPPEVSTWFYHVTQLFVVVDDDFLRFHKNRDSTFLSLTWIERKQLALGDVADMWSEDMQQLPDLHRVDLIITRYWLLTLLWQMALRKFALSSNQQGNEPDYMSLDYPIRLSHQLQYLLTTKPSETIEVHGTGILQKIFEIACTVADLLLHVVPRTCDPGAWSAHLDSFLVLHTFLFRMSKFYEVERNVLAAKLEDVRSVFPNMLYETQFSPPVE